MRCLVTGCAGFIGSHLCDRLLAEGHEVIGVDAFTEYYPRADKERNIADALTSPRFTLHEGDILSLPWDLMLEGVEVVFHQAAQAGVRSSWGEHFELYTSRNLLATQHLLEACRTRTEIRRFIYASSSSVYGKATELPVTESTPTLPVSPYGVTKLAGEQLSMLYHANFGLPVVALRYFTVYGARQRPDMAFHRFTRATFAGEPVTVYEDGRQTRDFTHVSDIVRANIAAMTSSNAMGGAYNIAGGSRVRLREALSLIEKLCGREMNVIYSPRQAGDVRDTYADISRARDELGYAPTTDLEAGLRDEVRWFQRCHGVVCAGAGYQEHAAPGVVAT